MNAPHRPLVVLAPATAADKEATAAALSALARRWRAAREPADVVFAHMDADKWGKWLKSMYGLRPGAGPAAVVASHHVRLDFRFLFLLLGVGGC